MQARADVMVASFRSPPRDDAPAPAGRAATDLRYDVVVAGAGPAGSSLALRLGRAGFRVALVDARRFPRPKPCGEFLSPACLPLLDELGVADRLRRVGARPVGTLALCAQGRRVEGSYVEIGRARPPAAHGWVIEREAFDQALLQAALERGGVELFAPCRVVDVLLGADGAVEGLRARRPDGGEVRLRAAWTIGADGLRSRVATCLGVRREIGWLRKLALTTRYEDVAWGDRPEVHFFEGGYLVAAPSTGTRVGVNLVLDVSRAPRPRLPRDELFEAGLERLPAVAERLRAGRRVDPIRGLGPLATCTTRQTFDGAALVGDACGYIDPVTGEGIYFALQGAALLAPALEHALARSATRAGELAPYLAGRARDITPRMRVASLLQRALRLPAFLEVASRLADERPGLADLMVSAAGDYVPVRELLRPSVWKAAWAGARASPLAVAAGG